MKAVVMAGGSGTRFWPLSRSSRPKQFLSLSGDRSFLQLTVDRLVPRVEPADIFVVCGPAHRAEVTRQLPWLKDHQVLVEPAARSTAACVGLAAKYLAVQSGPDTMAVLPSDHLIRETEEFLHLLGAADELAGNGWLVTFGIEPSHPATGYGYVERGDPLGVFQGREAFRVKRFIEKPAEQAAQSLLESGSCFWNSGMFVWHTNVILEEIRVWMPELHRVLVEAEEWDFDSQSLLSSFASLESLPVDIGILEKSARVATFPCRIGWSDVGGWQALGEVFTEDDQGNISEQLYLALDSQGCILNSSCEGKLVALLGVRDLVVVDTPDALLICDRRRAEEVKKVVETLKNRKLDKFL